jgi:hypothetical protein
LSNDRVVLLKGLALIATQADRGARRSALYPPAQADIEASTRAASCFFGVDEAASWAAGSTFTGDSFTVDITFDTSRNSTTTIGKSLMPAAPRRFLRIVELISMSHSGQHHASGFLTTDRFRNKEQNLISAAVRGGLI